MNQNDYNSAIAPNFDIRIMYKSPEIGNESNGNSDVSVNSHTQIRQAKKHENSLAFSVTKKLLEKMDGKLEVKTMVNQSTTFCLSLRLLSQDSL